MNSGCILYFANDLFGCLRFKRFQRDSYGEVDSWKLAERAVKSVRCFQRDEAVGVRMVEIGRKSREKRDILSGA